MFSLAEKEKFIEDPFNDGSCVNSLPFCHANDTVVFPAIS